VGLSPLCSTFPPFFPPTTRNAQAILGGRADRFCDSANHTGPSVLNADPDRSLSDSSSSSQDWMNFHSSTPGTKPSAQRSLRKKRGSTQQQKSQSRLTDLRQSAGLCGCVTGDSVCLVGTAVERCNIPRYQGLKTHPATTRPLFSLTAVCLIPVSGFC
jgi:hypothetical protein